MTASHPIVANDVLVRIRDRRREPFAGGAAIEIGVERIAAIAYLDAMEVWLYLCGQTDWTWVDARQQRQRRRPRLVALVCLLRDALALPLLYLWHALRVGVALRTLPAAAPAAAHASCLYLRLDHNFDLAGGGSVAHTAGVINALRDRLPRLEVLASDQLASLAPGIAVDELTPRYGAARNVPGFALFAYSGQVVRHVLAGGRRPDFMYARASAGNYAPLVLKARLRCPYICEYNGAVAWISRNWGTRRLRFERLFTRIETANLKAADLVVVVSEASAVEVAERGVARERILVNPNGVDIDKYTPELDPAALRTRLGIAPQETVLGFIGTFGPWHGTEVLARAFVELLRRPGFDRNRVRLLLIGHGTRAAATRDILVAGGAIDRVIETGTVAQDRAPEYLAACEVFVSPHVANPDGTPFFGSPTKLFEYMAMGRAIVASGLDQIGEVLADEATALLVPPGDAAALGTALARLVDDANLRDRLGAAARAEAVARYSWTHHTQRIVERFEALAGAVALNV